MRNKRVAHALGFYLVLIFAVLANSFSVAAGESFRLLFPLSAVALAIYFAYILKISNLHQRMMFLAGMFVCGFGENLLVYAFDLYHFSPTPVPPYAIPPYVVMGHGYAIWTALILGEWICERITPLRAVKILSVLNLLLFVTRFAMNQDWLGAVWIVFYLAVLLPARDHKERAFFQTTFLLTTFLEIIGIALDGWTWHAYPGIFGRFGIGSPEHPMLNPPSAVGAFYVVGDFLTLSLVKAFRLDSEDLLKQNG